MFLATLILPGWPWRGLVLLVLGLAAVLLLWGYRTAPPGPARWVCPILKSLGFAALAFCLLDPLWSGQRARPGANLFAILADNSRSLQVKDPGAIRTRGELLQDRLNPQHGEWLATLEDHFELRRYLFDARLESTKDFGDLAFDGRASALGSALRTLAERYRNRPLAGVMLLTDGNATDLRGIPDLAGLPPLYPVVMGRAAPPRDLAVQQVHVSQTAFEDAPVTVQADVAAAGYRGVAVVAQLLDASGRPVVEQTLRPRKDEDLLAFRFQLRPEKPGLSFYRVRVRAKDELGSSGAKESSGEATLANNRAVAVVDRGQGPYRILYVAGRPNWEFKFLNRAVQDDDQLQMVGLIRVAKREPKFNFLGRAGETSNPLFRGFGNQAAEDVERYDQPVLVRLNARDEFELRGGFPRTPEELYPYQAVVVDDLEAEFFTPDQAVLLQKFVSERGGGFLMLGGVESFQHGRYQRTPIGDMLPVYLDRPEDAAPTAPFHFDLTREGWLQAWARLRDNEADEKVRLQGMVPFQVLNLVRDVKPGASIVATALDAAGKTHPALVVQRFGRGRTAALMLGDLWRWGLHDPGAHHDMDKAWRQLMRWLVSDVPRRVELTVEPQPEHPNGGVLLQVRVRDPKFQPVDDAILRLDVQPVLAEDDSGGATNVIRLQVEPSASEPGLYQATYTPRGTAGYQASVSVTNPAGAEVGRAVAGWSADLAAEEFRFLTPNVALLETLARKTGGALVASDQLESFARDLPHRQAPVMDAWTFPVWHTPALFGFALACFLSEWGLRRWKGLP